MFFAQIINLFLLLIGKGINLLNLIFLYGLLKLIRETYLLAYYQSWWSSLGK